MIRIPSVFAVLGILALAVGFYPSSQAVAAGRFDGKWVLTAHAMGRSPREGTTHCPAFQVTFDVTNDRISGSAAFSHSNPNEVVNSRGQAASPITGQVDPNGDFTAQWKAFHITGKFTRDGFTAHWTGQCGPRTATGVRAS